MTYSKEWSLAIASLILIAIHLLVSFIFVFRGFKVDKLSGLFWTVSFVVCFVVLILLITLTSRLKTSSGQITSQPQVPCPFSLSYPNGPQRDSIQYYLDKLSKIEKILPYDKNRTYVINSRAYKLSSRSPTQQPSNPYIPIAYVSDNNVYTLSGTMINRR